VSAVLLHPLTGVRSRGLVWVTPLDNGRPTMMAYPEFQEYASLPVFRDAAAVGWADLAMAAPGGEAQRVGVQLASPSYFEVVGARAALGRAFQPSEVRAPVVVLSDPFWRTRFGADPAVVGRTIWLNGRAFGVVGVAQRGFGGLEVDRRVDMWIPLEADALVQPQRAEWFSQWGTQWLTAVAHLAPGTSAEQARTVVHLAAARLAAPGTATGAGASARGASARSATVSPLGSGVRPGHVEEILPVVFLAFAVAVLVLVIACANVATLLLGRGARRWREIGVRLALGAGRGRVVRLLLTESVLLSGLGALAAMLLATWVAGWLAAGIPDVPPTLRLGPDALSLAVTFALALVAGLVLGAAPALTATRADVAVALREPTTGGVGASRLRRGLVTGQLALSLLLLVTAGLFLRSLSKALGIDPGFDGRGNVLVASFDPSSLNLPADGQARFEEDLLRRVRAVPGVASASLSDNLPLSGRVVGDEVRIEPPSGGTIARVDAALSVVWPDYFRTLGVPVLQGRAPTTGDGAGAAPIAIVNRTFARRYLKTGGVLGRRVRIGGDNQAVEIVGVVADVAAEHPGARRPTVYLAGPQSGSADPDMRMLVVRSRGPRAAYLASAVRRTLATLQPQLPVDNVMTMSRWIERSLSDRRTGARLLVLFGLLALVLAAIGVYGVVAYTVAGRTREIGLRVALGAREAQVTRLFVGQGLRIAAVGAAIGLVFALLLTRALAGMLYGVGPLDVLTFLASTAVLVATALVAGYIPAHRAARIDAVDALRQE
jgi:putative ABC transport system permease protein